ncbi:MAG TPA: glycosyltransferase [Elusimicrobiales bacterium]|nr:glycosyltransferase [Elusimicrobiales bacterium]
MIKVLHIITRLDFGGAQANTLYTVAHLDRSKFDVSLLAGPGGILEEKAAPGTLTHAAALGRAINPLSDLAALFGLYRFIRRAAPDVVHTHSSKAGILGRLAAAAARVPVVVHTFHGFGFHPGQNFLKRGFFILLEKICALFSDALVFVSKDNMKTAAAAGIGSPAGYRLIRSGVKLGRYPAPVARAEKLAQLGIDPGSLVITAIANAKPQKNPGDFLEAAARLLPSRPRARFVFVGGGEALEALRSGAAGRGLAKTCLFPGWREDSAEILAASDIFALTSLWEGLPRSLVEALRTGLPAVCYRADGVTDILADGINGFSVEKNDLDGFCAALARVMDDAQLRARLAAGAAATDLAEFDIDHMVRQQEELYLGLLARKG